MTIGANPEVGVERWLEIVLADLRYALRLFKRSPGFTAIVISILAVAIGANTAMFGLLDAWLIRPLAFKEPSRLVIVLGSELKRPNEPAIAVLYRDFLAWKNESRSFADLAGMFWRSYLVTGNGQPEETSGMVVTADLFSTLGVAPELGRTFRHEDLNGPPVVVLSHAFWQRRYGGSTSALGSYITLNSQPHLIIGVMPATFDLRMLEQPKGNDGIWTLLEPGEQNYAPNSSGPIAAVGHLRSGVTAEAAQAELTTLQRRVESSMRDGLKGYGTSVTHLKADNTRVVRPTLLTLTAAVALVLLIACTNIGALRLGRTLSRARELSVRAALGSGRGRLLVQLLIENLTLCVLGAVFGVVMAYLGLKAFIAINPLGTLPSNQVSVNGHVLAFTSGLTILATLLFGLAPAVRASHVDLNEVMKSAPGRTATGRGRRTQGMLLSVQICLTMVVLVATGLLTETLIRLSSQPIGILSEKVAVMEISLPKQDFPTTADVNRFYDQWIQRVEGVPGVEAAAATTTDPVYGAQGGGNLMVEGQPLTGTDAAPEVEMATITPGYFSVLSVPLLAGRTFLRQDNPSSEPMIVISAHVARTVFRGQNPTGKRVRVGDEKVWRKIIGVVGDVRFKRGGADRNALEWVTSSRVYIVHWQGREEKFNPVNRHVYVYLRGPRLPTMLKLRALMRTLNPEVPVAEYEPLTRIIGDAQRQPRLRTVVLSGFAILALLLAALGIYGVVSQSVIERTNEIGIRMALGADSAQVRAMVIGQGLWLAAAGMALGIVGSLSLYHILGSQLYGVRPTDPVALGGACALLFGMVAIASYLPARRASRLEPMGALHYE